MLVGDRDSLSSEPDRATSRMPTQSLPNICLDYSLRVDLAMRFIAKVLHGACHEQWSVGYRRSSQLDEVRSSSA